jgi:hypothetical protein
MHHVATRPAHDPRGPGRVEQFIRVAAEVRFGRRRPPGLLAGFQPGAPLVLVPVVGTADPPGLLRVPVDGPVAVPVIGGRTGDAARGYVRPADHRPPVDNRNDRRSLTTARMITSPRILRPNIVPQLQDCDPGSPAAPPTPKIRAYVEALLERWPDLDEDLSSPWSTSPLMSEAIGSLIYFPMAFSMADEASAFAAEVARQHGLVCYDPQLKRLRP